MTFGGISLEVPQEWRNITPDLDDENAPFTLARDEVGVGALQFSIAKYKSGEEPHITVLELTSMLHDFAENKHLGEGYGQTVFDGEIKFVGESFSYGNDFLRVWHFSDGRNIALITYTRASKNPSLEVQECEEIVRSIRFT